MVKIRMLVQGVFSKNLFIVEKEKISQHDLQNFFSHNFKFRFRKMTANHSGLLLNTSQLKL